MDKINKFLRGLSSKRRKIVDELVLKIEANDVDDLNCKKLRGSSQFFRVKKSEIRIIFKKQKNKGNTIVIIEKRKRGTYKNL